MRTIEIDRHLGLDIVKEFSNDFLQPADYETYLTDISNKRI